MLNEAALWVHYHFIQEWDWNGSWNSQERMHGLEEGAELGKLRGDKRKF